MKTRINITGLGWFGAPLAVHLLDKGYEISGTTRSPEKKAHFDALGIQSSLLTPFDPYSPEGEIVILNIPPFEGELSWFKSWNWNDSTWVIFISSTSGSKLLLEQEEWIKSRFKNWTILRFGGLFGNGRHPGKHLSGRTNLKGPLHPVNLIHLEDTIGATTSVIEKGIKNKIIHVVCDEHPTKRDYYSAWCKDHNLPLPEFDLSDTSSGKVISSEALHEFYVPRMGLKD